MQISKRLLYSSLLAVGLVIVLVASSVSAMTAYGYSDNHNQTTQTGWRVSSEIKTEPATGPSSTGGLFGFQTSDGSMYLFSLQGMVNKGTCDLTGMVSGQGYGTSGECTISARVTYQNLEALSGKLPSNVPASGTSVCKDTFKLGASQPEQPDFPNGLPAWIAMPPYASGLFLYYGVTINGQPVSDFRVSSSVLLNPTGSNTFVCSNFLFEGYSADLFVPAQAGHYNFSGTSSVGPAGFNFGTFQVYHAKVTPMHQEHRKDRNDHNDN
jgi:hypothetical protein